MSNTRWTIVTGASSGIGAELARGFASIGHHLVLVARRRDRLASLARSLEMQHRGRVEIVELDLALPDSPDKLFAEISARGIVPHSLVNNAGFGLQGNFAEQDPDQLVDMIDLNVTSLTRLCRIALPGMIERGRGGILNVASLAAFQAGPHMAVYYATKAYVLSLSEALHDEAKPHGVTVTALCPGPTQTEFQTRAGIGKSHLFRSGGMNAADVAQAGIDGFRAGHAVVVPGIRNSLSAQASRFLPRSVMRGIAGSLNR